MNWWDLYFGGLIASMLWVLVLLNWEEPDISEVVIFCLISLFWPLALPAGALWGFLFNDEEDLDDNYD